MLRTSRFVLSAIVALAAASCGDDPDPTVSGAWLGISQGVTLQLTLSQNDMGTVTGSGTIASEATTTALTVGSGTHVYPNLSLTLQLTGFEDMNYTGTLSSPTTISGSLNGSGFDDFAINLEKQ